MSADAMKKLMMDTFRELHQTTEVKNGSSLNTRDYKNFYTILEAVEDDTWYSDIFQDSSLYPQITATISHFRVELNKLNESESKVREVEDIQPLTLQLLRDLKTIFNLQAEICTENVDTSYRTMLQYEVNEPNISIEKKVVITGESDKTINYKNVPIGTFEDNNMPDPKDKPSSDFPASEKAQALAELAAASEQFFACTQLYPKSISSMLTNGSLWKCFVRNMDGSLRSFESEIATLADEPAVIRLLCFYFTTMKNLEATIDSLTSSQSSKRNRTNRYVPDPSPTNTDTFHFNDDDEEERGPPKSKRLESENLRASPAAEDCNDTIGHIQLTERNVVNHSRFCKSHPNCFPLSSIRSF
jgi:hypothetical protein